MKGLPGFLGECSCVVCFKPCGCRPSKTRARAFSLSPSFFGGGVLVVFFGGLLCYWHQSCIEGLTMHGTVTVCGLQGCGS